jgi:hypothetical protein
MEIQVLLLANSKKLGGRCLAGLRTDTWTWFRPVSDTKHGAISTKDCEVVGGVLRPLDLMVCEIVKSLPAPHQAENWLIKEGSIRLISHKSMIDVEDRLGSASKGNPYFLGSSNPSISPSFFSGKANAQPSLALIEVESALVDESRHIHFTHENRDWNLKLTDEYFSVPGDTNDIGPAYLCISVGEYWQKMDSHWKFVAGVIPMSKSVKSKIVKGQLGTVGELSIALFGAKPILSVPRFSTDGWFYQGPVSLECQECDELSLHSFRKHYLNNGNIAHYWGIICESCKTAKELADFDKNFIKNFKAVADEQNNPSLLCISCS